MAGRSVKRSAEWQDVTGMATQTQPALGGTMTGAWWPSKYGPDDQAGALNEITPGKVLEAVRLVRRGRAYDLAHVLHQDIPAFPGRTFHGVGLDEIAAPIQNCYRHDLLVLLGPGGTGVR